MGTPAQIGKTEYRSALDQAREANVELRQVLKRLVHENPSSLVQALAGRAALALGDNDEALNRLDEIGRRALSK